MRVYCISTKSGRYFPRDTEGNLYDLQDMVGGFIEPVYLAAFTAKGIILLANEEGLRAGLNVNFNMYPYFLVGPVVALSVDEDRFVGLNPEQEKFMREWLERNG